MFSMHSKYQQTFLLKTSNFPFRFACSVRYNRWQISKVCHMFIWIILGHWRYLITIHCEFITGMVVVNDLFIDFIANDCIHFGLATYTGFTEMVAPAWTYRRGQRLFTSRHQTEQGFQRVAEEFWQFFANGNDCPFEGTQTGELVVAMVKRQRDFEDVCIAYGLGGWCNQLQWDAVEHSCIRTRFSNAKYGCLWLLWNNWCSHCMVHCYEC